LFVEQQSGDARARPNIRAWMRRTDHAWQCASTRLERSARTAPSSPTAGCIRILKMWAGSHLAVGWRSIKVLRTPMVAVCPLISPRRRHCPTTEPGLSLRWTLPIMLQR